MRSDRPGAVGVSSAAFSGSAEVERSPDRLHDLIVIGVVGTNYLDDVRRSAEQALRRLLGHVARQAGLRKDALKFGLISACRPRRSVPAGAAGSFRRRLWVLRIKRNDQIGDQPVARTIGLMERR